MGNTISVEYDIDRLKGTTFGPGEPATLLSVGGVLENMLQACGVLGLEVVCSRDGDSSAYFTLAVTSQDEAVSPASFTDHPLFKRHTNRFPYTPDPIPAEIIQEITGLREGTAQVKILDTPEQVKAIGILTRQASEVRFQNQEVHEWLARSLRYTKTEVEQGDGLDLATIPLPPGGRIFMRFLMDWKWMSRLNRLGVYKLMASLDAKLLAEAPTVIALLGGSTREEIIDAGRLLTRVWIDLNSKGIAVQPYYVISDQLQRRLEGKIPPHLRGQVDIIAEKVSDLLGLAQNQRLHMLLRIGYPTRDPVRSKRLPLSAVCREVPNHWEE
ncbi:nitroreductase family protein [Methylocaldum szegediense]|uniref:hypothetical protein n=1 Tax=Methylocaldum szegediense TaxID=73780 RepID=UPI00047AD1F9|nr:hypothetical protein [Methylocaldum szegediense]